MTAERNLSEVHEPVPRLGTDPMLFNTDPLRPTAASYLMRTRSVSGRVASRVFAVAMLVLLGYIVVSSLTHW